MVLVIYFQDLSLKLHKIIPRDCKSTQAVYIHKLIMEERTDKHSL